MLTEWQIMMIENSASTAGGTGANWIEFADCATPFDDAAIAHIRPLCKEKGLSKDGMEWVDQLLAVLEPGHTHALVLHRPLVSWRYYHQVAAFVAAVVESIPDASGLRVCVARDSVCYSGMLALIRDLMGRPEPPYNGATVSEGRVYPSAAVLRHPKTAMANSGTGSLSETRGVYLDHYSQTIREHSPEQYVSYNLDSRRIVRTLYRGTRDDEPEKGKLLTVAMWLGLLKIEKRKHGLLCERLPQPDISFLDE